MVLKELILTADPVEWINLINFKKITNILVILNTCNSSIFFFFLLTGIYCLNVF